MRTCLTLFLPLFLAGSVGAQIPGNVRVVDADAPSSGGSDGTSWGSAYLDLRTALIAVQNDFTVDEIWVANGTYYPHSSNASESFDMRNDLEVLGGFAGHNPLGFGPGNETNRRERDPASQIAILSGDIDQDGVNDTDNSNQIVLSFENTPETRLDGFTITMGRADGPLGDDRVGGGVACIDSELVIANCTFIENAAGNVALSRTGNGGAIGVRADLAPGPGNEVGPRIISCTFRNNWAVDESGGAIWVDGFSTLEVVNCLFDSNDVTGIGTGGAIASTGNPATPEVLITNCTFVDNEAGTDGGGAARCWPLDRHRHQLDLLGQHP